MLPISITSTAVPPEWVHQCMAKQLDLPLQQGSPESEENIRTLHRQQTHSHTGHMLILTNSCCNFRHIGKTKGTRLLNTKFHQDGCTWHHQ